MSSQLHDSIAKYIASQVCARRLMPEALREIYAEGLVYLALSGSAPKLAGGSPKKGIPGIWKTTTIATSR